MINLSNERLVNSAGVLSKLSAMELPIRVSYDIAKNIEKIEKELKVYNSERQKLMEKYSVKGEDGKTKVEEDGTINIQKDLLEDWNNNIKELYSIENEIDIHQISINELISSKCNITPSEMIAIGYMFEE